MRDAREIAENGFTSTGATDEGYYGRGVYFTSDLRYAAMFATIEKDEREAQLKVVVASLVIPGNAFPVTEWPFKSANLKGRACATGYQSHYTVVDSTLRRTAFPATEGDFENEPQRVVSDELVTFEGAQVLPVFIIYCKAASFQNPDDDNRTADGKPAPLPGEFVHPFPSQ